MAVSADNTAGFGWQHCLVRLTQPMPCGDLALATRRTAVSVDARPRGLCQIAAGRSRLERLVLASWRQKNFRLASGSWQRALGGRIDPGFR